MILSDALDWNKTQIANAKLSVESGVTGPHLEMYQNIIRENEEHNKDIEWALRTLKKEMKNE